MRSRFSRAAVLGMFLLTGVAGSARPASAEEPGENSWRFGSDYVRKVGADFKDIFTSPGRWRKGDWAIFAALAGTGALLFSFDEALFDEIQDRRTAGSMDASAVISKFGNGGTLAGLMAALYASGELFGSPSLRRTALLCLESFVATEAFVWAGKIFFGRSRPYAGDGPYRFELLSASNAHHSFPSGDASGAFAVASVIAAESESFALDALAYGLAGLAAVWRVHDRKHWPSDVFVGSVLGIVVGRKVVALNRGEEDKVGVSVQAGGGRTAVSLRFSF